MRLPQEFQEKMGRLMKDQERQEFIRAIKARIMVHSLRVNTLKLSVEEFRKIFPYELEPVPWCAEGFYLPKGFKASKHPYYYAGLYYLQDPSSMLPGRLLAPAPGERVLDLCAAPGGKSTQIGAAMEGKGLLVLNEVNSQRIKALIKNVENFGIRNAVITSNTPQELASVFSGFFHRVLVDAPCSGEGMFRREARLVTAWRRSYHPSRCVPLQREILEYAAEMVAPGGRLVYSTCTFNPEENEGQVKAFLERRPDFCLEDPGEAPGASSGRGEWVGDPSMNRTVRIWPHLSRGEGQFAAVLRRKDSSKGVGRVRDFPYMAPTVKEIQPYLDFCREAGIEPPDGRVHLSKGDLHLLPDALCDLQGLKAVRIGLYLGSILPGRFQPSNGLAPALERQTALRQIDLPADDSEVIRYLKGETLLPKEGWVEGNGWLLVSTDGFPLGFAKRLEGIIKNHFPASWRIR